MINKIISKLTDTMENLDDILFPETAHDSKIISLERHSETANFKPGDFIDHYQIISELGQGGMGIVYKAMDTFLNRIVALKIMLILNQSDQIALKRFQREAEICATLKHPYIVSVYTIGEYKSFPYIVMEYIEGIPINQYVQQNGENDWNLCATIIYKVAQALEYVHSNHIIHRDIKPSNILVRPNGDPVLMDFGIGKILYNQNKHNTLTKEGEILGTLFYSSPEQTRGQAVSEKTDIYSIGVILYQLLTKQCPFYADNTYILLRQISTIIPTPPCMINKSIPDKLQEVSLRCMEKNPKYRYSIEDLLSELHSFLSYINSDTVEPDSSNQTKSIEVSQTYKKVIWLRYYKASIFTALFILLICVSSVVALFIGKELLELELYNNNEVKHTTHLYTIKLDELWKENSNNLVCTLFKEFGNMYKEKAIKSNDDNIKIKNSYFSKAFNYYKYVNNYNDKESFERLIEIEKLAKNEKLSIDLLQVLEKYINNETWNTELYKIAGNICIDLTKYYYKLESIENMKIYKKKAQSYLEKYIKKFPSDKGMIYAKLATLEIYDDNTTILENISNIEQKIKIKEHTEETYWYYSHYFENICKKRLEEQKKLKKNVGQENFNIYVDLYLNLCKKIELEKKQEIISNIFNSFLYCNDIRPILKNRIAKLEDELKKEPDKNLQQNLQEKIENCNLILKEQVNIIMPYLLANFYMTQDEPALLQKFYNDKEINNKLMKISLSKNEEPFLRFLAIFALIALPDEHAHKLIKDLFNDDYNMQLASTYKLSKKEIDLEQAKLWVLILDEHLDNREKNFKKLLTKLSDEKKLSDEILLIIFSHIDRKLLTIINDNDKFYNLTYKNLLEKNNLEILLIKIQQDLIYNIEYIFKNFKSLTKVINKILAEKQDNKNYQFFCLQFLKIYHENLSHKRKNALEEIEKNIDRLSQYVAKNVIEDIKKNFEFLKKYQNVLDKNYQNELDDTIKDIEKILGHNDSIYAKEILDYFKICQNINKNIYQIHNEYRKFQDDIEKYARENDNPQLQLSALFFLRKNNPKSYEELIKNIINEAQNKEQSTDNQEVLTEDIQIDIASYWMEQGKIEKFSEYYNNNSEISITVLLDMLGRSGTRLEKNYNSLNDNLKLIEFLKKLLKEPSKLKNKELRYSILYLFAYHPMTMKFLKPWIKNWLGLNLKQKSDIFSILGTIFSSSKYCNNLQFNKNIPQKTLIQIAKDCINPEKEEESYIEQKLKAIAYSLVMLKAYYYINDISLKNPQEVKNEKILREKLEKLHQEIIDNILDEEIETKIKEKLEKYLYYGIALGYSNILYNDVKYLHYEDFEIYRNFKKENDPLTHHRKHFYNQFVTWSSNLYTERLPIIVYELQKMAKIREREKIFERDFIKDEELFNKEQKEHIKRDDLNVNNILRLKLNLQDYVQCLKQSIYCYKEAIKNEPRQELNDVVESILNNDFLLQRQLELGIIQSIIAEKMRASNENNRKILEEARQNIKEVQDAIKNYIFKQYQQLKDKNVKQKIVSFIQNNNPEDIVNSIIENNIAFFKPLIQDYYFCEKYLAFSYYVNNETEESNKRLEKCKKQNLWDYDIYKWLVEDKKIEPDPFLFDRLFLRDLNLTHF